MAVGPALIVTGTLLTQPAAVVYVMRAEPAATPVTVPPDTVATAGLLVLHAPPAILGVSTVVAPIHALVVPVKVAVGLTETTVVEIQPPPLA